MRMDRDSKRTAADLVNKLDVKELTRIIRDFGEELWAERIASFIVAAREKKPIETTGRLVEIIKAAIPAAARRCGPHPARRTFQALRIAVNDELANLEKALRAAISNLRRRAPGGYFLPLPGRQNSQENAAERGFRLQLPPGCRSVFAIRVPQLKILTASRYGPEKRKLIKSPRPQC